MAVARARPAFEGVLTPSPTAVAGGKPLLTLYSISLQWADYDEAADTAAKAGWPAIGWTVRNGGHVAPENVARDLPKAIAAAKKAGLQTPIIITPVRDVETPFAEAFLDTMSKLGLRYYQAPPLGQHDYSKDLQPQLDVWKSKIEKLAKLNEKLRHHGGLPRRRRRRKHRRRRVGSLAADPRLRHRSTSAWTSILATRRSKAGPECGNRFGSCTRTCCRSRAKTFGGRRRPTRLRDRGDPIRAPTGHGPPSTVAPGEGMVPFKMALRVHEGDQLLWILSALQRVLREPTRQTAAREPAATHGADRGAQGRLYREREA